MNNNNPIKKKKKSILNQEIDDYEILKYMGPIIHGFKVRKTTKRVSPFMSKLVSIDSLRVPENQKDNRNFYERFVKPKKVVFKQFKISTT